MHKLVRISCCALSIRFAYIALIISLSGELRNLWLTCPKAVAEVSCAACGGREEGERIGGCAPVTCPPDRVPPVKGLAALCKPAFSFRLPTLHQPRICSKSYLIVLGLFSTKTIHRDPIVQCIRRIRTDIVHIAVGARLCQLSCAHCLLKRCLVGSNHKGVPLAG